MIIKLVKKKYGAAFEIMDNIYSNKFGLILYTFMQKYTNLNFTMMKILTLYTQVKVKLCFN